jgi:hypothetical protein
VDRQPDSDVALPQRRERVIRHGTASEYTNHSCRCADCRAAWAAMHKRYVKANRARMRCVECSQPAGGNARCLKHRLSLSARRRASYRAKVAKKNAEATGEGGKIVVTKRRRATGVEGPMNAPGQFAPKEAYVVAAHSIKAGA